MRIDNTDYNNTFMYLLCMGSVKSPRVDVLGFHDPYTPPTLPHPYGTDHYTKPGIAALGPPGHCNVHPRVQLGLDGNSVVYVS